jgi:hypothetical protein
MDHQHSQKHAADWFQVVVGFRLKQWMGVCRLGSRGTMRMSEWQSSWSMILWTRLVAPWMMSFLGYPYPYPSLGPVHTVQICHWRQVKVTGTSGLGWLVAKLLGKDVDWSRVGYVCDARYRRSKEWSLVSCLAPSEGMPVSGSPGHDIVR